MLAAAFSSKPVAGSSFVVPAPGSPAYRDLAVASGGTGTVIATGDIVFDDGAQSESGFGEEVRLSLVAGNDVLVGRGWAFGGLLLAGRDVEIDTPSRLEGIPIAHREARLNAFAVVKHAGLAAPPDRDPPPDGTPPTVTPVSPLEGQVVAPDITIRMDFADSGSGIDPASGELVLDGVDRTVDATVTATFIALIPSLNDDGTPDGLPAGSHEVTVTVRDQAGNPGTATVTFTVAPAPSDLPPDPATVAPPVDQTVAVDIASATAFLYSGDDPIQTGVAPGAIEARRVAILRGRVLSRDGSPLPGAMVTLPEHPELGSTLSRAGGYFDLAVNGGGSVLVQYAKEGYLPAQRRVEAPWRDYASVDDVVLVPLDGEATVVTAGAESLQVARGSVVSDQDANRRATLLFPEGSSAEMVLADGSRQPLSTLTVRATEYTVGEDGPRAMPAPLPASSGYTYAVELSVDEAMAAGAASVEFSRPVPFYVENFLDFPVGSIVPAGIYDRGKAAWLPSPNGRVIAVLSATAGLADLDLDGSGAAADAAALADLGITDAERRELAALYAPGQSLWRVPVAHFSPLDCNWPYGPPDDAEEPPDPEEAEDDEPDEDDDCTQGGSVIECGNQILGESVPVVGTPFRLHYQSDRVPGRRVANRLNIRLTGASVPATLRRVDVMVDIAGRRFAQSFAPTPNASTTFEWDGRDGYGRPLNGRQPAFVQVGFVYGAVYYEPADLAASFGSFSSNRLATADRARFEVTLWRRYQRRLGLWDARAVGLGGWSLSAHHAYDPGGPMVLSGNGARRRAAGVDQAILSTVSLGGATENTFSTEDVAADTDGSVVAITLQQPAVGPQLFGIRRRLPEGTVVSHTLDNRRPTGIGVGAGGDIYYTLCRDEAGALAPELGRLSADGTRTILLGAGALPCPVDVVREPDGSLLIADLVVTRTRAPGGSGGSSRTARS